ncbi:MAG: RimJ/RimL family protein N-acetyltransferase [Cognaticolwellia sp.]|jgi:RimJ/RimL family protein N-acetyltransferase
MKVYKSKTVQIRLVEESDAEFILSLRLNEEYNTFLSSVTTDVEQQRRWIQNYKEDEASGKQYYFIIETLKGLPCGTVRVYDLKKDSFCWGSWILNENKTRFAALESAFLVYDFGFQELGFNKSHFDVMKGNEKVISFHEKMGAIKKGEDDNNYYYDIFKEDVLNMKRKLQSRIL